MKKEQLVKFRLLRKMSILKMATLLNVNPNIISQMEKGNVSISSEFEECFFNLFESSFTRVEKDIFKERYPYNGIKLLDCDDNKKNFKNDSIVPIIVKFRKANNLTQEYLANQLGISPSTLCSAELGKSQLPDAAIIRFNTLYDRFLYKSRDDTPNFSVTNFIVNNDLTLMLEEVMKLKVSKSQLNTLYSDMVKHFMQSIW